MYTINKQALTAAIAATPARSAWDKGVRAYALDLVDNLEHDTYSDYKDVIIALLNGADNWTQYSYGGCALIWDGDIAARLCTPAEYTRKRGGELIPNSRETWLDVQARALGHAQALILRMIRRCVA
nr:MAG TPA: hypothetical protein [Caudoviricetes sp.]